MRRAMKPLQQASVPARSARTGHMLAAALVAALLAGCSFTPALPDPAPGLPQRYPAALAPAAPDADTSVALPDADGFFTDPRTQALVRHALAHNRDLRVALLQVAQARALLGVQQADGLPSVGLGATVDRSSTSGLYSAGLSASWELDLFGRVRAATDAAAARLLAGDESRRAVALSLAAAVADTELALRADDALIEATAQVLAAREATLALVQRRLTGGVAAAPELRANESLVAAARASLAQLQRQRAQRENALALLLGAPPPTDLPPPRPLLAHALPPLAAGAPSALLLRRPDLRAAEQQLLAANAGIGAARASLFPRIALTGSAGTASTELGALFDRGAWSFGGQLLQPLFDAGRNRAQVAAAESARDIALAQYERAVQAAFREVADALAARATLAEQLQAQRAQAAAERERLRLTERLLAGGVATQLERLDAERAQLAARQAELQLELAVRQNDVLLWRVLGGPG